MNRAEYFRFRTGSSGLTDDELIHFDWFAKMAMYDCWSQPIFAEDANLSMNLAFLPHMMEDEVLRVRMEQWHRDGLFLQKLSDDDEPTYFFYSLTKAGGALWAAERLPIWDCYYAWESAPGDGWLFVTAPNREIASQYLRSAIRCRYINSYKRPRTYRLDGYWPDEDFPWPRFKRAWQLRVRIKRNDHTYPNGEQLEKERMGWSTPEELIALRLQGKLPWPDAP